MPARAALIATAVALGLAACSQPGTQAPLAQARRLDEATRAIATSCGYAEQISAFGDRHERGIELLEASAAAGARTLLSVDRRVPTDIYQGETVTQIVSDSAGLLGECGLPRAQRVLLAGRRG